MTTQSEQALENNLIKQLVTLGYERVRVTNDKELVANFKVQLERLNEVSLSDHEFKQILNSINKGSVFNRAGILRDRVTYMDSAGETRTVQLLDGFHLDRNHFQVTQQVRMAGRYQNRYDVTVLINGLPLVQIELKRRGLELKEAFNQINRYEKHSYWSGHGLFQFVQLFVISNGVNTKYFANNAIPSRSYKQTFYWSSEDNRPITDLTAFATAFLNSAHLAKMITQYIVLNETEKMLMVLRPYQYYATEAIVERVKSSTDYGYIWHTTGSGKTLTSFKTAQILTGLPAVHKVVFVVDRKDLDYQTGKEFNKFAKGSIDATENTTALVGQLTDDTRLVVTTIQKLNNAISKQKYLSKLTHLLNEKVVFIFDECHRSQFGEIHGRIKDFFSGCQMFGFTGTPIFAENAIKNDLGKRTTAMLFGDCLHKYVITDAIRDENVLRFSIEYLNTFKQKQAANDDSADDVKVEAINESEVFDDPRRLNLITDYIIQNHPRKTHNRAFTAIFCVSSVDALIQYYQMFLDKKARGEHQLRLATIFSYQANEADRQAQGIGATAMDDQMLQAAEQGAAYFGHSRDHLECFIGDYNQQFDTNYTTRDPKSFYNYYNDIAKRVKARQIDVLLVVNMFLTGFDSKPLNTLYVDKNLQHHGLIQAFSRTNRIYNELKSQGNIVCFRNLKEATDDAIRLFSSLEHKDEILIPSYEEYLEKFNRAYALLISLAPTVDSVNELQTEDDEFAFVQAFRTLMRLMNVLTSFTDFSFDDLDMADQEFEDYKSKYLDLHDKVRRDTEKDKVSILEDLDFELELIHRDDINVSYIVRLLKDLKEAPPAEHQQQKDEIIKALMGEVELRSKRELIEQFINKHLPLIADAESVPDAFDAYWEAEKQRAIKLFSETEHLDPEKLESVIGDFLYTNREPMREDVISMMKTRPKLKERATTAERLIQKVTHYVDTFVSGMGG